MSNEPVVTIKNGALKGCIKTDYQGKPFYSFQGIPYAKPPVGDLRFRPPQPAEPWRGVRDATKEGDICYSMNAFLKTVVGSEDCLFVNVYTPELPIKSTSLKPVMFLIHGGGFTMGSGNTDFQGPEFLISEDVVLVTINYRLGLLGFLNFDDTSLGITGNAGLKDQVLALKWVNENISKFGGDPNNVTIFGVSAGGASVHYLILSPLAKGLFHKAILQSGTAIAPWALCNSPKLAIAERLGMTNATDLEISKVLLAMPVEKIFQLQQTLPETFYPSSQRILGPVVENKETPMPFLSEHPLDILHSGHYNHVPIMIGFTSREGILYGIMSKLSDGKMNVDMSIESSIPHDLIIPKDHEMYTTTLQKIKKFYYGSEEPTSANIDQHYLLHGDISFIVPVYATIRHHSSTSLTPIFLYRMSVESNLNGMKKFIDFPGAGICHGDDILYLFKNFMTPAILPNSVEEKGVKTFIKLWTQFAKTGNPNPPSDDDIFNVTWKPVETDRFHYLEIGENVTTGVNPDYNRLKFWKSIYDLKLCKCNM